MGDADITLRHLARRRPEDLVRALVPEDPVEVLGWLDSQVTNIERRLDLRLRVGGEPRVIHVEFCFALLARNATAAALREVVAEIHAGARTAEERAELYTALLVMAMIDPWRHNLLKELIMMVEDEEEGLLRRTPIIGEMILEAERRGEQRGVERGERRGEERGEEKAIAELLGRLFARRIGRRPTADEERSIVERARALGPGEVEDALLDLEAEALVRWLAEPIRPS
ncbi:hypothetical protein BE21_37800 [Sorangium cellulosum]|uniref:DUF4351 domain-containing protein n=1 Tax=Sorangium cellulosum TaxID=56 RepID=A0A150TMN8_SORCE|nr:hypothetical protein BE21_37800 [Sorangium cellulosum]